MPALRVCTLRRVISNQGDGPRKPWTLHEEDIPPYVPAHPMAAEDRVGGSVSDAAAAATNNHTNPSVRSASATCEICASASSPSFLCLAIFCSNQSLLLRFVTLDEPNTMHILPWFKDDSKRIQSMYFSRDVKHLLCLCADGSLYVVSVLALMRNRGNRGTMAANWQAANGNSANLSSYARDAPATTLTKASMDSISAGFVQAVDLSQLPSQDVYLKFGVHGNEYVPNPTSSLRPPSASPEPVKRSVAKEYDADSMYSSGYATCCAWWSRVDNNQSYILIGSSAGKLLVLSCAPPPDPPSLHSSSPSSSSSRLQPSGPISINVVACVSVSQSALVDIKIVQNAMESTDQWAFALTTSASRNTYRIPLLFSGRQHFSEKYSIESTTLWHHDLDIAAIAGLERASTNDMFKPERVATLRGSRDPTSINLESLGTKGFGLGILNHRSGRLQLVLPDSPLPFEFPLFEFQTFKPETLSGRRPTLTRAILSNRVLYTISQHHSELSSAPASILRVNVLSALVAARCCSRLKDEAADWSHASMQEFCLPVGWSTDVVGVFRLDTKMVRGASLNHATSNSARNAESQTLGSVPREHADVPLDGVILVTRDAVYECSPRGKEDLEDEFYRLVTPEATRPQGELFAQSLGINVLSMYEQAADRVLRNGGSASVALALYKLSNATCEKITLELVKAQHCLLAASFARQYLYRTANGSSSIRLSLTDSQALAHRIILCYIGSSMDSCSSLHEADPSIDSDMYIPSGVAVAAAPFTHPALLHFLETSFCYDLGPTMKFLLDKYLVGAMLVAAHSRDKIDDGIRLLLRPESPRVGAAAMDFLVASGHTRPVCEISRGQLVRSLPLPLQIRFATTLARSFPHLLVDLLPLVLNMLPRLGHGQLDDFFVALDSGSSTTSLETLAAFKLSELSATVLLYMARSGDALAHSKLVALLQDPLALSIRTDIMAARCADFEFWDAAAVVYEAHKNWLQVLRCRLAHVKAEKGVIDDPEYISVVDRVMANMTNSRVPILEYVLLEWVTARRETVFLESFLYSKVDDIGTDISLAVFRLDTESRRALDFSARFSFQMAKIQLNNDSDYNLSHVPATSVNILPHIRSASSRSRTESLNLWSEIRHNLAGMNTKKNRNVEVNAEVLLTCRRQGQNEETNVVVAFTCGHAFAEQEFQDSVLPRFRQQLGGRINLPVTTSALMKEYSGSSMVLPCPKCLFRALCQESASTVGTEL